jgi:hypothetical protein
MDHHTPNHPSAHEDGVRPEHLVVVAAAVAAVFGDKAVIRRITAVDTRDDARDAWLEDGRAFHLESHDTRPHPGPWERAGRARGSRWTDDGRWHA